MPKLSRILNSFRVKVTLAIIASLLFVAALENFFIYKFAFDSQFNQLRQRLKVIAQTAALAIDAEQLDSIPLVHESIYNPAYRAIAEKLTAIKKANPGIKYVYTMSKTGQEGMLQFIVDPDAINPRARVSGTGSYPGDRYDASGLPEMSEAFLSPTADKKISSDQWGRVLSAYAPVKDRQGRSVAIIGVDITADDVYLAQRAMLQRGIFILIIGVIFSFGVGIVVSRRITRPIGKLAEGTRRLAEGDLGYRVDIRGKDEIAGLAASFNNMAGSLLEAKKKMHDYFFRAMLSMVRLLEAKDPYTKGHSDRVADFSEQTARVMGLPEERIELVKRAAQLHDIGKLVVDERILNKTASLNEEELEVIHQHPQRGREILQPVAFDKELLDIVGSHHERYDGKGYPDRLKGETLDLACQIIPVADAYDAMTFNRSYRPAMSKEEATAILKKNSGSQFNPRVVEAFLRTI